MTREERPLWCPNFQRDSLSSFEQNRVWNARGCCHDPATRVQGPWRKSQKTTAGTNLRKCFMWDNKLPYGSNQVGLSKVLFVTYWWKHPSPLKGYIDQSTNFSREVGKAIFVVPFFKLWSLIFNIVEESPLWLKQHKTEQTSVRNGGGEHWFTTLGLAWPLPAFTPSSQWNLSQIAYLRERMSS